MLEGRRPGSTCPASPLYTARADRVGQIDGVMAGPAGEPPGVFNVVCGDRGTGRAVVTHPAPAMVSITGSVWAGKQAASPRRARFCRVSGCIALPYQFTVINIR